ncbi:MAG TPA: nucleotidyl transferase AbiEii/AbiGii toxin family protein [Gammaproteobacteria bacterium]|nr:nucleotidyl transferase AbiEii/AbiGii toxin family protein [Gammaproteobacteria bacterium]
MNNKRGKNTAASVRDRLLALSRERGEDFQLLLTQYGLERLLYRLSESSYQNCFVLKGAMLFLLWGDQPHRPTRDVDFLGFGDSDEAGLRAIFRELCDIPVEDDGLTLMADSVQVEVIRDQTEYGGLRVRLFGDLAGARVPIQADIGFGDAVTPKAKEIEYPTLLGNPAPHLKAYPRETVVAEKYQAVVHLGMANSRMKDFYDLWVIAREFDFDGLILSEAIRNTFSRRRTSLPEHTPSGLSPEFYEDAHKNNQWNAFIRKGMLLTAPPLLMEVCLLLETFLLPPTQALIQKMEFGAKWEPGGPWH